MAELAATRSCPVGSIGHDRPAERPDHDPLALLRTAGAAGHRRVDRIVLARLRSLTATGYADLLTDLAAVHLPLDDALRSCSPVAPRPVRGPLAADLALLGRDLPEPAPGRALVTGAASALGALYVVEGSTAGGPTVAHLVRRRLGLSAPVAFLLRAGDGTGWWQAFATTVRAALVEPDAAMAAAAATQATFARFADGLERADP